MPKPTPLRFYKPVVKSLLLLDKISKTKSRYLTFAGREDGIGAQIHSIFSLHAYAFLRNMTYLHSPMKNIAHNDGCATWDQDWNDFFNIPQTPEATKVEIPVENLSVKKQWILKSNTLYRSVSAHPVVDLFSDSYTTIMPKLRKAYDRSFFNKKNVYQNTECLNIAVHARRGDALNHPHRASNTDSIKRKIIFLKQKLAVLKTPYEIHIFSQGEPSDFKLFEKLGVQLHLNTDLFVTFHSLVTADVFLMAKSSLSYAAALLSNGKIVYDKFWHPKLKHWHLDVKDCGLQKFA